MTSISEPRIPGAVIPHNEDYDAIDYGLASLV